MFAIYYFSNWPKFFGELLVNVEQVPQPKLLLMSAVEKHVLIADDDQDDYLIFSLAIADFPFAVLLNHATDGQQLMQMLDKEFPDILFLDVLMPYKDGKSCLKEIRANKKFDMLPIIMYSSVNIMGEIETCYRAGANLYLVKPGDFSELKKALHQIISSDWKKTMYYPPLAEFVYQKQ